MHLTNLHTFNYRNIEEISLKCDPKINCIIGKNGIGKTNLLDSIYYLSFCKSNIVTNDSLNVKQDEESFLIKGSYLIKERELQVNCAYTAKEKSKQISCDGKKYTRFSDHIGLLPLIFISPSDISLINGGGSERRRFIDTYISLYNKQYLQDLVSYNKILAQRNSLLKQVSKIDYTYLSIIDESLIKHGISIYNFRKEAIIELSKIATTYYKSISEKDDCEIVYDSQLNEKSFSEILEKSFERDSILGYTSHGVHRDDLSFSFNGGILKTAGSQGQKKSFLLALKFAQYQSTQAKMKTSPILLLDDLFDKLDTERTKKVFDIIDNQEFGQIFITDTDKALLETFFARKEYNGTFWKLDNGKIKSSNS